MPRESPCQAIFYVREKTPVSNIPEWLEDHVSPTPELLLHTLDRYHLPSKNRTGIFDRNPVNTVTTRGARRNCWHVAVEKRQAVAVTPNRRTLLRRIASRTPWNRNVPAARSRHGSLSVMNCFGWCRCTTKIHCRQENTSTQQAEPSPWITCWPDLRSKRSSIPAYMIARGPASRVVYAGLIPKVRPSLERTYHNRLSAFSRYF